MTKLIATFVDVMSRGMFISSKPLKPILEWNQYIPTLGAAGILCSYTALEESLQKAATVTIAKYHDNKIQQKNEQKECRPTL